MKKLQLFIIPLFFGIAAHAQSFFIRAGKNYTKFDYQNAQTIPIDLHSDVGNSYEVGCTFPIKYANRFHYELGLQLNDFNAYTEAPVSGVTYNLQYFGVNNSLLIGIIDIDRNKDRFSLDCKAGLGIFKYVAGKEAILGKIYDLQTFPEFRNVFVVATIGLQSKFVISDYIDLSLGYDRSMSFLNTGNANYQSLSFTSNQFKVGIHFQMN